MKVQGKAVFIVSVILLAFLLAVIFYIRLKPSVPVQTTSQSVKVKKVETTKKEKVLELTGSVDAVQTAVIASKVEGRVAELRAENGDRVAAGQILLKLEDSDYVNALAGRQAVFDKARSNLATIKADYERSVKLFESGAISRSDLDNVINGLKAAEADEAAASAALAAAREALGNTEVTTPVSGVVANRSAKLGQMLEAGTPVMIVQDISSVNVLVEVQQKDLNLLRIGQSAVVEVDTYPGKQFPGRVAVINPAADPSARVFETKIKVENRDGLLKAGMFAEVSIRYDDSEDVLAVPVEALSSKQGIYYVFVPEDGVVRTRQVEIGSILGNMVEIKNGLSAGQPVVVTNVNKLKDQDRIIVSGAQEE